MTPRTEKSKPGCLPWVFLVLGLAMIGGGAIVNSGVKNPQHAVWRNSQGGSQSGYLGELTRQAAASADINKGAAMLGLGWGAIALGVLIATICVLRLRRKQKPIEKDVEQLDEKEMVDETESSSSSKNQGEKVSSPHVKPGAPRRLSFVVVVFDWNVKTWLDRNIGSEQEGFQFGLNAVHDIGGAEVFELVEDLLKREGATALTMMGMRDWSESAIVQKVTETFGTMPGIAKSQISMMMSGSGPEGGRVNVVFFGEE